jgi:hypothetical protein
MPHTSYRGLARFLLIQPSSYCVPRARGRGQIDVMEGSLENDSFHISNSNEGQMVQPRSVGSLWRGSFSFLPLSDGAEESLGSLRGGGSLKHERAISIPRLCFVQTKYKSHVVIRVDDLGVFVIPVERRDAPRADLVVCSVVDDGLMLPPEGDSEEVDCDLDGADERDQDDVVCFGVHGVGGLSGFIWLVG